MVCKVVKGFGRNQAVQRHNTNADKPNTCCSLKVSWPMLQMAMRMRTYIWGPLVV